MSPHHSSNDFSVYATALQAHQQPTGSHPLFVSKPSKPNRVKAVFCWAARVLTRVLAIQASLPAVAAPSVHRNPHNTGTEVSTVTSLSATSPVKTVNVDKNISEKFVMNPQTTVDAHGLAFSAQKPDLIIMGHKRVKIRILRSINTSEIITPDSTTTPTKKMDHYTVDWVEETLANQGFISQGNGTKPLHSCEVVAGAIDYISQNELFPENNKILAETIKISWGNAAEKPNKFIHELSNEEIINVWILSKNIFDKKLEDFIVDKALLSSASIEDELRGFLKNKITPGGRFSDRHINYVLDKVAPLVFPMISQKIYHNIKISPDYGYSHAGLLFAKINGIDRSRLTEQDAIFLGEMIYLQLTENLIEPDLKVLFRLPAKIHYLSDKKNLTSTDNIEEEIKYYFSYLDNYEKNRYNKLKNTIDTAEEVNISIRNYKTRWEISQEIIDSKGCKMTVESYLNSKNECVINREFSKGLGAISVPPIITKITSENATEKFIEQNNMISKKYEKFYKLLLNNIFDGLTEEEKNFIFLSEIKKIKVELTVAVDRIYINRPGSYGRKKQYTYHEEYNVVSEFPDIDLFFVANNGTKEKFYAIKYDNKEYSLIEINDAVEDCYKLLNRKFPLKEGKNNRINIYYLEILKTSRQVIEKFIEGIAKKKSALISENLYKIGYQATTREKLFDFFISLIPFCSCIENIKEKKLS